MALKKITANDFNTAINILTTSDKSVWWKYLDSTDDGTELCLAVGWQDGYDEDADLYQQDGYTLCAKIGYKHSNTMVMDYSDFREPYDKKGNVWQTDMAVAKGPISDSDVKWYNDEAEAIWSKYGVPNSDGTTALDLMESKKKSEARPSYYDHPLLMAATAGGKTIYSATEDGDMFTDDEKEAYVFRNFDIISSIAEEDFLKVAKHYLGKTAKVDYVPAKGAEESKKSEAKKSEKAIVGWDRYERLFRSLLGKSPAYVANDLGVAGFKVKRRDPHNNVWDLSDGRISIRMSGDPINEISLLGDTPYSVSLPTRGGRLEPNKSEAKKPRGSMRRKQESIQKKKESVLNSVYPVITSDDTLRYALLATTRIRKNDMVRIVPCIEYQGKLCQVDTGRVDDPVWYRAGRISDNKDLHNDKAFVAVVDTPQEALQEFRKLGNPGVTRIAMQSENRVYWDDVSDEGTIKVKNTAPFRNDYYDIEVPDNGTTINDGIDGSMGGNNWRATVYWKPKDAVTAAFKWLDNLMAQARKKGDSLVAQQSDHRSKGSAIKSRIATFQDDAD